MSTTSYIRWLVWISPPTSLSSTLTYPWNVNISNVEVRLWPILQRIQRIFTSISPPGHHFNRSQSQDFLSFLFFVPLVFLLDTRPRVEQVEREEERKEHFLEATFTVWLLIRASLNCWDRDYRTVISSIKDRFERGVILVAARTGLFVIYGEQVIEEPHLVRFVRLYETERVTSETLRGKSFKIDRQDSSRIRK